MTSAPLLPTVEELQADPASSYWLKFSLQAALGRDPVDAANESELLAAVLAARARRALTPKHECDHLMPRAFDADAVAILASDIGFMRRGEALPRGLLAVVEAVVDRCASIGDRYADQDGTAGDEIRANFVHLGSTAAGSHNARQRA